MDQTRITRLAATRASRVMRSLLVTRVTPSQAPRAMVEMAPGVINHEITNDSPINSKLLSSGSNRCGGSGPPLVAALVLMSANQYLAPSLEIPGPSC